MSTLLLDVTDDYNHARADDLVQSQSWRNILVLVRQEDKHYIVPSIALGGNTMRSTTTFRLLYVPLKSDAYSFASGYLSAAHSDEEVVVLTTVQKKDVLLPLINSVTFSTRFLHCRKEDTPSSEDKSSTSEEEEEDSDDEEEEEDDDEQHPTSDDILMTSIMETLTSEQGMKLITSVMGSMGGSDSSS